MTVSAVEPAGPITGHDSRNGPALEGSATTALPVVLPDGVVDLPDGPVDLPDGVVDLACSLRREADRLLGSAENPDPDPERTRAEIVELLTAPLRLDDRWPAPTEPFPVGGGWIHIEVIDDDRPSLDGLLVDRPYLDPEQLAGVCQELRFPVSPYRSIGVVPTAGDDPLPAGHRSGPPAHRAVRPGTIAGTTVVDLTTHWAGPLVTELLAAAGAHVVKLDPTCRPDGFRSRPELYRHLNGSKEIVDLDLRSPADRKTFERLVADADLVVESFSRRVMANLGYHPDALYAIAPKASLLSMKAFPAGSPEQDWLAFGPGVHAASGLGLVGSMPTPAPVAYPDPLAGLTGFVEAVNLLADGERQRHVEVSLRGAIEPLVALARRADDG